LGDKYDFILAFANRIMFTLILTKTGLSLVPPLWKYVMYGPYFHNQGNKRRQPLGTKSEHFYIYIDWKHI